jgi:hypothetical protein
VLGNAQIKLESAEQFFPFAGCDEKSRKRGQYPIGDNAELLSGYWQKHDNFHPFPVKHCISVKTNLIEKALKNCINPRRLLS